MKKRRICSVLLALTLVLSLLPATTLAAATNIAQGKAITATDANGTPNGANGYVDKAGDMVDGSLNTRWASTWDMRDGTTSTHKPKLVTIDLGEGKAAANVTSIKVYFFNDSWATDYTVATAATTAGPWTTVGTIASRTNGAANQTDTITPTRNTLDRYVRFTFSEMNLNAASSQGVAIKEIEIYGELVDAVDPDEPRNLALNRPATASSSIGASNGPDKAVDGDTSTLWVPEALKSSTATDNSADDTAQTPQWLYVDLGAAGAELTEVRVRFRENKVWAMEYELQTTNTPNNADSWERFFYVKRASANASLTQGAGQDIAHTDTYTDIITTGTNPALTATTMKRFVRLYIHKTNAQAPGHDVDIVEFSLMGTNPNAANAVDLATALANLSASNLTVSNGAYTATGLPEGFSLAVRGSTVPGVVAQDGTLAGTNIGSREVTLLVRLTEDATEQFADKNLTVTVPDNKSALPAAWFPAVSGGNAKPGVVPTLQEWYGYTGTYTLSDLSKIVLNDAANVDLQKAAKLMQDDLKEITGLTVPIATGTTHTADDIYIASTAADTYGLGEEGYVVRTSANGVEIYAATYKGAVHGTVTVEQMLWLSEDGCTIPRGVTRDYPSFTVRGVQLDIARTPYRYQQLLDYVKIMRWYKISEFALQLNDNDNANIARANATDETHAGFHRLESTTYPSLISETKHAGIPAELVNADYYNNNPDYQGNPTYTKAQWRDLQALAQDNGFYLLTEINTPAHSLLYNKYADENPDNIPWLEGGIRAASSITSTAGYLELMDLTGANKTRALRFAREMWDEYTSGSEPTIYGDIVHLGADEYWAHTTDVNNAFASFVDTMRQVVQTNLGADTKIRMFGAGTSSFQTAPTVLNMTHQELAQHYQLDIWDTGYENPATRIADGYGVVNSHIQVLYGNPGRTARDVPNSEYIYNSWDPTMFGTARSVKLGEPNLLGAKTIIWGDQSQEGMTELDVHQRVLRATSIISEATWGAPKTDTFSAFELRTARLAEGPGTQIAMELPSKTSLVLDYDFHNISEDGATVYDASGNGYDGALTGGSAADGVLTFDGDTLVTTPLKTLSYPYTVSFDLSLTAADVAANDKESSLLSGYDGRVQIAGKSGHVSADVNYFTRDFGYTVPAGRTVNLTLVGTFQATRLYVDGQCVSFLSQKQDQDGVVPNAISSLCSSVPLALEKLGQDFHGSMSRVTVYNKALSAAEVAALHAGTDDGYVNISQNTLAGGSSYHAGDVQDNSTQRTAIAMKAVDGEEEEIYSFWQGDHDDSALTLDLGQTRSISKVDLVWHNAASGSRFKLQSSNNGTSWVDITSATIPSTSTQTVTLNTPVATRYLRLQGVSGTFPLQELKAFEAVSKTALTAALEPVEAYAQENELTFGAHSAIFDTLVLARAIAASPLATQAEVDAAAAALSELDLSGNGSDDPTPPPAAVRVDGVSLNIPSITLYSNVDPGVVQLIASVSPANADNKTVTWTSSKPAVATVSNTGLVEAVGNGTTTITVTTQDGGFTAACTVTVKTYSSSSGTPSTPAPSSPAPSAPSSPSTGSVTQTDTASDGTVTQTSTAADGTVTKTVTSPAGQQYITVATPKGDTTLTVINRQGETMAKVSLPAATPEVSFTDVRPRHWAWEGVQTVAGLGLFHGTSETTFSPAMVMDRGMVATVLHRLSGGLTKKDAGFKDVASTDYYNSAVNWASAAGIITGITPETFVPGRAVTRQELATMLYRYAGFTGLDIKSSGQDLSGFTDVDAVGGWALSAMEWAVSAGVIQGKDGNRLAPADTATRAEVAIILSRFIAKLK